MALIKLCPTCKTKNDPGEFMCSRCLGDISGVTPLEAQIEKEQPESEQLERAPQDKNQQDKEPRDKNLQDKEALQQKLVAEGSQKELQQSPKHELRQDQGGQVTPPVPAASVVPEYGTLSLTFRTSEGREIVVHSGDVIGRKAIGADVIAPHKTVSRRHARFTCEAGRWYIEDLNSTNETYLDDVRLETNRKTEIKPGQRLTLSSSFALVVSR